MRRQVLHTINVLDERCAVLNWIAAPAQAKITSNHDQER